MNMKLVFTETGENRPPLAGEWFRGYNGVEDRARFDFSVQSFPILRMSLVPDEEVPISIVEE